MAWLLHPSSGNEYESGWADAKFSCRSGGYIPDLTGMTVGIDYVEPGDGTVWVDGFVAPYDGLQVKMDGNYVLWEGNFDALEHEYTKVITGSGATVEFSIFDSYYPDNDGFITVNIYKKNW